MDYFLLRPEWFSSGISHSVAYIYVLETKGKQQSACSKCTRKPSFCLKPKVCSSDFGSTLRQCIGLPTYNTSFKFIFHTSVGRLALASNSPVNKATIEYGVDNLFGCHRALYVGTSTYVDRKGKLYRWLVSLGGGKNLGEIIGLSGLKQTDWTDVSCERSQRQRQCFV